MGVDDGNIQVTDGCRNDMHNGKLSNINIPTCSGYGSTHEHNISLLRCIMLFKGADRIHKLVRTFAACFWSCSCSQKK